MHKKIVFFDGYCNLCNTSINLLMKLDRKGILYFAPLTGQTAKNLNIVQSLDEDMQSVVYYRDSNQIFDHSEAAIQIILDLHYLGKIALLVKVFPKFARDLIYRVIAKNRYRLFGKTNTCRLPTKDEKERFLE